MECNASDINAVDHILYLAEHHYGLADHFAMRGDIEAAQIELERAIALLNSTQP